MSEQRLVKNGFSQRLPMTSGAALPQVTLACDGSCEPNPGAGGWGVVLVYGAITKIAAGRVEQATNQTMEITAVIEGLRRLKKPCQVTVITDSKYVVNCATGEWQIRANEDLWREFFEVAKAHTLVFHWVRGHAGNDLNERAHELAYEAIQAQY